MRVLVCGSRDWTDADAIFEYLREYAEATPGPWTVIHGGARGADVLAAEAAKALGHNVESPYLPDYERYGSRRAPIMRNLAMLGTKPDAVFAFMLNGSPGTSMVIAEARRRGIRVNPCFHETRVAF
jgi:hypothetical protein